jgi:predicted nuclease of predicted toxin-antitoxin system
MKFQWRLLLDQNVRNEVKKMLEKLGVDVIHASDVGLERALDPDILQYAVEHNRVLITQDTEFGDLSW